MNFLLFVHFFVYSIPTISQNFIGKMVPIAGADAASSSLKVAQKRFEIDRWPVYRTVKSGIHDGPIIEL